MVECSISMFRTQNDRVGVLCSWFAQRARTSKDITAINHLQMLYHTSGTLLVVCSFEQIVAQQVFRGSKKMVADLLAHFLEFGFRYRETYHCRPATFCNSILPISDISYAAR